MLEVAELLIEMPREKQRAVGKLALGHLERALAELQREIAGADRDRDNERRGAQDKPLDRAESDAPWPRFSTAAGSQRWRCPVDYPTFPCPYRRLL